MKKDLVEIATGIVKKLRAVKHIAYFAGGAPRDILMKKDPADIDIATDVTPDEVQKIFSKTVPVGKRFGVVIVIEKDHSFEVTTFRTEHGYSDARRPDSVSWTSAKEDALRRDFTCNGLFYDPIKKEIIDYVDGQKDIEAKILRFIGDQKKRIEEDNLRILRAVRFKNHLDFEYDSATRQALIDNAEKIKNVSAERIREELGKILVDHNREKAFRELSDFGILKIILPEVEEMKGVEQPAQFHAEGDVWEHTLLCLKNLGSETNRILAWAILLHDVGKPPAFEVRHRITFYRHTKLSAEMTEKICDRLCFSNKEKDEIVWLVKNHLRFKDLDKMKPAKAIRLINHPYIKNLLEVSRIDSLSSYLGLEENLDFELYDRAKALYDQESKKPKIKKLVSGFDVMKEFNLKPGPKVGKILKLIEDAQLEGEIKTNSEAIKYAKDKLK
jgi:poly(A) polymerase